jgi:hypothetical protein
MAVWGSNAVGMTDGRANALTVVLPLKWWGRWWLRAHFALFRTPIGRQVAFRKSLDPLRFISAIRWSLLEPFDPPRRIPWERPPSERWHLLFESNFDGDWDEYLDNFGAVMKLPLESIIWTGIGYPGLATAGMFKAYAKAYDVMPEHYVSAYPRLAAGDIRQELHARDRSGADRRRIVRDGFGRTEPRWSTFLFRVVDDRIGDVVAAARSFELEHPSGRAQDDAESTPLLVSGRVHFGRIVVVDRPGGSWLLITLTHDGPIEPTLRELIENEPSSGGRSRWRSLLEGTVGVPVPSDEWWDDERLVEHLLEHRPASSRHCLTYCGYPGTDVQTILTFVDTGRRFTQWPASEDES